MQAGRGGWGVKKGRTHKKTEIGHTMSSHGSEFDESMCNLHMCRMLSCRSRGLKRTGFPPKKKVTTEEKSDSGRKKHGIKKSPKTRNPPSRQPQFVTTDPSPFDVQAAVSPESPCTVGGMAPGLGSRSRYLLGLFHRDFDPEAEQYPAVRQALAALDDAVQEAFPPGPARRPRRPRGPGRPKALRSDLVASLKSKLKWCRVARRRAEQQVRDLQIGKQAAKANRLTPEFLAKVALSSPSTCARSFSNAWRDLVGIGVAGCTRPTVARVRDAFAQVVKEHNELAVRLAAGAAAKSPSSSPAAAHAPSSSSAGAPGSSSAGAPGSSSAGARGSSPAESPANFVCAALLHIHDEASLRLRSSADSVLGPRCRSRRSKVQQHSVRVYFPGQQPLLWFAELHPLADKTAKVLATSLHKVLRDVSATIAEGFGGVRQTASSGFGGDRPAESPWFLHILVGDGIATNEAACKILLAWVRSTSLDGLRYFVMSVKCASHQANLAVAAAVCGRAALAGAHNSAALGDLPLRCRHLADRSDSAARCVCGAIVRFFKFLVSDYYSDFLANLHDIVGQLSARELSPERQENREKWLGMQSLYGEGVFPPGLLDALNGGVGDWVHCLSPGPAADAPADRLLGVQTSLREILRRRILVVDEQPTLSRMWTFQNHVACFLLLHFLGCIGALVKFRGVQPRPRSRKRVDKVLAFFRGVDSGQYLRRTSLALQLAGHALSICGQLREDTEPLLVRLAKGVVGTAVCQDLHRLLHRLHLDPDLDKGAAVAVLLAETMDLCLRFRMYSTWPFAAWTLSSRYNLAGYIPACMDFLDMPEDKLDVGFGLQLKRLAEGAAPTPALRLRYLLSSSGQKALQTAFQARSASSLPVERAFAETKRSEAPRLCHVATAGRNQILRQYLRQREELLERADHAAKALRRSLSTNLNSLAWELRPDLADRALEGKSAEMQRFIAEQQASR